MSPVGGSRHYDGGGLGQVAGWGCPSCGAENSGPLVQGCSVCGAGRPGRHIGREEPPPPPPPEPPPPIVVPEPAPPTGDIGTDWADRHPDASLAYAYRAGYLDGVSAMRQAQQERPPEPSLGPEGKIARTIVAALAYFADQVLRAKPEEVQTGEWCSVEEVRNLIDQLTTTGEVSHA